MSPAEAKPSPRMGWRLALLAAAILLAVFPPPAGWVERFYSTGFYPRLQSGLTAVSNLAPFAAMDVLLVALVLGLPLWWILRLRAARGMRLREAGRMLLNTLTLAAAAYLCFLLLWGFNYRRLPLTQKLDYDQQRLNAEAMRTFYAQAVERVNAEYEEARRGPWPEEARWRERLHESLNATLRDFDEARGIAAARPKRSLLSFYLAASGVTAFVSPFTHEVIWDPALLPIEQPFVLAHEWAHLAGYGNEAEASFVGALACIRSDVPALRYAGWLAVYQHASYPAGAGVAPRPSAGVLADLRAINERMRQGVRPRVSQAQARVYNRFLKASGVREGIASYSLLTQLIVGTRFEPGWVPVRRSGPALHK